ncbi:hypothetical protein DYB32_006200 [Aphanomyces invadans]|uniref:Anaphase-promoting complex subunit 4 WD40 domain-containing protein n=1 Tax=Aphanomyces invadans TaxID=157072 RepID=A0A418ASA7_9STRA|nr:hypothetical protein DYB32_006200 [Aphanomyces invadans]
MTASSHAAARIKFRQHRLLPSGCMQRKGFNVHVVGGDVHGKYFAFCSTLAVYVYDIKTLQLYRLLSTADNLAGLAWCMSQQYGHWLASVSLSRKVVVYDIETEQIVYDVLLPHHPVSFQWHPLSLQLIVATADPLGKTSSASTLLCWTIDHPNRSTALNTLRPHSTVLAGGSAVTVIRFNTAGTLAIGLEYVGLSSPFDNESCPSLRVLFHARNGCIVIYNEKDPTLRVLDKKKIKKQTAPASPSASNAIIDLQWDGLSTIYLLVATRDGHCALWEVTDVTGAPLHSFDKQGSGTSAISW